MRKNFIDVVTSGNEMITWERHENGKLYKKVLPLSNFLNCYMLSSSESNVTDIYGRPLKEVKFSTRKEMRDFVSSRDNLFESDINVEYKAIEKLYAGEDLLAPVNVMLYDIENDFDLSLGLGYPRPDNPYAPINSFQFYLQGFGYGIIHTCQDDFKHPVPDDGQPLHVFKCENERELLLMISTIVEELDVDVMGGWNTHGYDLPMIMIRATMEFGEDFALSMLCRDGMMASTRSFVNKFGEDATQYKLKGRHHIDMMEIYKKFNPGERPSWSLEAVCQDELGQGKVAYKGDLGTLYKNDPELFFEYAYQDARLLKDLDDKTKMIQLAVVLSRMNGVKINDVLGAVRPIEMGFMNYCHRHNVIMPDKKSTDRADFPGAIVYDTIADRHGWVMTLDLGSLYPSTAMMLGLSPETLLYELDGGYLDYIEVMSKSDRDVVVNVLRYGELSHTQKMKAYEMEELIRENGWTIGANGAIFSGVFGLLSGYMREGMDKRKEYRAMIKTAKTDAERERYDVFQKVVKIHNNSIYGVTGEPSFRFFDVKLSAAITMTARIISKFQANEANRMLEEVAA